VHHAFFALAQPHAGVVVLLVGLVLAVGVADLALQVIALAGLKSAVNHRHPARAVIRDACMHAIKHPERQAGAGIGIVIKTRAETGVRIRVWVGTEIEAG